MIDRTRLLKRSGWGTNRHGPTRSMIARKWGSTRRRCRTANAQGSREGVAAGISPACLRERVVRRRLVSIVLKRASGILEPAGPMAAARIEFGCRPARAFLDPGH